MAITPAEALSGRSSLRMQQKTQLESTIDAALSNFPDGNTCVVEVAANIPNSVFNEVLADYQAAGWTLSHETDFHGNRQITFQAT